MLQLLSSDSGLDDTIQVLFNVILLLDGGNEPFSLLSACLVRLQALLRPPVLYYSRKVEGLFLLLQREREREIKVSSTRMVLLAS